MKTISGKRLCKILEQHDWQLQRIKGSHYIYARDGNSTILTIPVHVNQDIKTGTLHKILKDAGLTEADL